MSRVFEEGGEVLAEITDSHFVVHKGVQRYKYSLDSLTWGRVFPHETEPSHPVVFGTKDNPSGQTITVVWSTKEKAEEFERAVRTAVINP